MDEDYRRTLDQYDRLQRLMDPYHGSASMKSFMEDQQRLQSLVDASRPHLSVSLSSQLWEQSGWLERINVADEQVRRLAAPLHQARAAIEAAGIPDQLEKFAALHSSAQRILVRPENSSLAAALTALPEGLLTRNDRVLEIAGRIRSPWFEPNHATRSLTAISKLSTVADNVSAQFPYSEAVSTRLRDLLGDWRQIELPAPGSLISPNARLAYYDERGFDREITDLEPEAFDEVAEIIGLIDDEEGEPGGDTERAMRVFRHLREIEELLRIFVAEALERTFGDGWVKHQVDGGVRARWEERQEAARNRGRPEAPLIAFADFTDYVTLIGRKDNWTRAFCDTFQSKEDVQESLRRLAPIRVDGMHARLVTLDDELLVISEVRRIRSAITSARKSWAG